MARILVVDDEANIRASLKSALDKRGHDVVTAATCSETRRFLPAGFDVLLLDVMLPDGSGLDILVEARATNSRQVVVMISGQADIETAVTAIRQGAFDFIEKPLSLDRVLITIDNATRIGNLDRERSRLSQALYGELVGESPAMRRLREDIARAAPRATRFLILGENGTGKELVANLIHSQSRFATGPFVAVNCAALPKELVESELFGHTAGAFTGATKRRSGRFIEANGGTIFLDEISEMPLEAQAKILRVIESSEVTPVGSDRPQTITGNIVAASNRNLERLVAEGGFRQDLYYRLNVVTLHLSPLRERRHDIPLLAEYFLSRFSAQWGEGPRIFTADALAYMSQLEFRGNVRELRNLVERAGIYGAGQSISAADLRALAPMPSAGPLNSLKAAVDQFEAEYIRAALARNGGNVAETARQLGLERSHLYKKLKKFEA